MSQLILTADDPKITACQGNIWDAGRASKFDTLAESGRVPFELSAYLSDSEFTKMIEEINSCIQWGFDQRRCCCPIFILLWIVVLGPILIVCQMFCCHYPIATRQIDGALEVLRSKGLQVRFEWGMTICGGSAAITSRNRILISLPEGAIRSGATTIDVELVTGKDIFSSVQKENHILREKIRLLDSRDENFIKVTQENERLKKQFSDAVRNLI